MAVGDTFSQVPTAVANGGFMDIQPSGTVEAVIHNLYLPPDAVGYEIQWYDGTTIGVIETGFATSWYGANFHCKNGARIRVKNTTGNSQNMGYDGVVTHA